MTNWAIGILPLVGVIIGAALQYMLTRAAEKERHVETLRTEAYVDYLRSVAAAAHLRSDEDLRDAERDAANAKTRIAVYGSSQVIGALAQFEKAGAVLNNANANEAFLRLVVAMRPTASKVSAQEIELLLFGASQRDRTVD